MNAAHIVPTKIYMSSTYLVIDPLYLGDQKTYPFWKLSKSSESSVDIIVFQGFEFI